MQNKWARPSVVMNCTDEHIIMHGKWTQYLSLICASFHNSSVVIVRVQGMSLCYIPFYKICFHPWCLQEGAQSDFQHKDSRVGLNPCSYALFAVECCRTAAKPHISIDIQTSPAIVSDKSKSLYMHTYMLHTYVLTYIHTYIKHTYLHRQVDVRIVANIPARKIYHVRAWQCFSLCEQWLMHNVEFLQWDLFSCTSPSRRIHESSGGILDVYRQHWGEFHNAN